MQPTNLMYWLCTCSRQVVAIGQMDAPGFVKNLQRAPLIERMIAEMFQIFLMAPRRAGSIDMEPELEAQVMY